VIDCPKIIVQVISLQRVPTTRHTEFILRISYKVIGLL